MGETLRVAQQTYFQAGDTYAEAQRECDNSLGVHSLACRRSWYAYRNAWRILKKLKEDRDNGTY